MSRVSLEPHNAFPSQISIQTSAAVGTQTARVAPKDSWSVASAISRDKAACTQVLSTGSPQPDQEVLINRWGEVMLQLLQQMEKSEEHTSVQMDATVQLLKKIDAILRQNAQEQGKRETDLQRREESYQLWTMLAGASAVASSLMQIVQATAPTIGLIFTVLSTVLTVTSLVRGSSLFADIESPIAETLGVEGEGGKEAVRTGCLVGMGLVIGALVLLGIPALGGITAHIDKGINTGIAAVGAVIGAVQSVEKASLSLAKEESLNDELTVSPLVRQQRQIADELGAKMDDQDWLMGRHAYLVRTLCRMAEDNNMRS